MNRKSSDDVASRSASAPTNFVLNTLTNWSSSRSSNRLSASTPAPWTTPTIGPKVCRTSSRTLRSSARSVISVVKYLAAVPCCCAAESVARTSRSAIRRSACARACGKPMVSPRACADADQCRGDLCDGCAGGLLRRRLTKCCAAKKRQPQAVASRQRQSRLCRHTACAAGDHDDTALGNADRLSRGRGFDIIDNNQPCAVVAQCDLNAAAALDQLNRQPFRIKAFDVDRPHRGVGPLPRGGLHEARHPDWHVRSCETSARRLHGDEES